MSHSDHPVHVLETARAVRALTAALHGYGLHTRPNLAARTVNTTTFGVATDGADRRVAHRLLLRPHGGSLWWWILWPPPTTRAGDLPDLDPLAPMSETADVARRVYRSLVLTIP